MIIELDSWAVNAIITELVKNGRYVLAVIIIRQAYKMGIHEAIEYYKSLPEYKGSK